MKSNQIRLIVLSFAIYGVRGNAVNGLNVWSFSTRRATSFAPETHTSTRYDAGMVWASSSR